jgi:hypothetical protein
MPHSRRCFEARWASCPLDKMCLRERPFTSFPSSCAEQLKIRPSPVKVIVSSALCNPHPQRPVTRARDGARALDDQLLLHLCKARHDMKENRPTGVFVSMPSVRVLKWKCWLFISLTSSSNPSALRPRRSTQALDYIEIYKRLASDSDGTAGEKVSVFCRAA